MKTIGQLAYEQWIKDSSHPLLSSWEKLPKASKERWERIAREVAKAIRR